MASLDDAEVLWRAVDPIHWEPDGTVQSAAFKTQELSIHRSHLTTLDAVRSRHPGRKIFEFTAGQARAAGASDVTDFRAPDDEADHGLVLGTRKGSVAKKLRDLAVCVFDPTR